MLALSCLLDIRPFDSQALYQFHQAKMSSLHLPLHYFDNHKASFVNHSILTCVSQKRALAPY
jgi:hypothetical protein